MFYYCIFAQDKLFIIVIDIKNRNVKNDKIKKLYNELKSIKTNGFSKFFYINQF